MEQMKIEPGPLLTKAAEKLLEKGVMDESIADCISDHLEIALAPILGKVYTGWLMADDEEDDEYVPPLTNEQLTAVVHEVSKNPKEKVLIDPDTPIANNQETPHVGLNRVKEKAVPLPPEEAKMVKPPPQNHGNERPAKRFGDFKDFK